MTSIEKSTMKTTTVATLIASLITGSVVYFSSVMGLKEGYSQLRYEMTIEINNLKNSDKLIQRDVADLQYQTNRIDQAVMTYKPAPSFK